MSTQKILAELPHLSVEERASLPCVANLHPGAMIMAPDFNDPLPDEFWFGKES